MPNGNGSPKGNPEGLGEMMKRVLHAVQLAVPIGIITRPNIAQQLKHNAVFQQMLATKKFLFEASSVFDGFHHVTQHFSISFNSANRLHQQLA